MSGGTVSRAQHEQVQFHLPNNNAMHVVSSESSMVTMTTVDREESTALQSFNHEATTNFNPLLTDVMDMTAAYEQTEPQAPPPTANILTKRSHYGAQDGN